MDFHDEIGNKPFTVLNESQIFSKSTIESSNVIKTTNESIICPNPNPVIKASF